MLLLTIKRFTAKLSWCLALLCIIIYIALSISVHSVFQFYLASFINGMSLFFFFVFYNIAHFKNTGQKKTGQGSALMFTVPSLISIIAPFLAGYFVQNNIMILLVFSVISFVASFYLINFQLDFKITFNLKESIKEIKATQVFLFLEGMWEALPFAIIPIYTLYFIKNPFEYGIFFSYLALISIIANLTIGKLSDHLKKRIIFLYPLTIAMVIVSLLFTQVHQNISIWILATSFIQVLLPLFWNVSTAMFIDTHHNLDLAIPGREIILSIGRILGITMVYTSFLIEKTPYFIFILLAIVLVMYPVMLFWNTKISKKYSYL